MLRALLPLAAVALTACTRAPRLASRPMWTLAVTPRLGLAPKLVTARVVALRNAPCGAEVQFDWGNGSTSGHTVDCEPGEEGQRVTSAQMWLPRGLHEITVRVRWADGEAVLHETVDLR